MTFQELQVGVFTRLNKSLVPDPVTQARVQTFVNDRYRELMRLPGIDLRGETLLITTESGRARYALPTSVTEIYNITDTTNRILLRQTTLQAMRQRDPSIPAQQSGVPYAYAILNEAGIGLQPTIVTAGALEVVSSSVADVMTGVVEYMGNPSAVTSEPGGFYTFPFTLTGNVPVLMTPQVQELFRIQLASVPVGIVVIRQVLAPTIQFLQLQGALGTALHKWVIHLWPTPGGAYTYAVDFERPRRPLVAPGDEPALPEEFHTMLVYGACAEEALKMDDGRAQYYEGLYQNEVKRLRAFVHQVRGQRLIPSGRGRTGFSTIGPFFPSNEGQAY